MSCADGGAVQAGVAPVGPRDVGSALMELQHHGGADQGAATAGHTGLLVQDGAMIFHRIRWFSVREVYPSTQSGSFSSGVPSQSESMASPQISASPGEMSAFVSSQSPGMATVPLGHSQAVILVLLKP